MTKLEQLSSDFTDWLKNESVPLWASVGIEDKTGCSYERLHSNGLPDLTCNRRVRVNYRQMFVFSMASHMNWIDNGEEVVNKLNRFIKIYGSNPNSPGTFAHLLNSENQIIDPKQDTYDLAFYLLACAWRYKAFKDETALIEADKMMINIDTQIKGIKSGWLEGDYPADARRQNPHMHLFEAFMALHDASNKPKWLARAGEVFSMFESHFYDHQNGIVLEYFNADWTPQFGTEGKIIEPGHMLEWVWLLREYSARTDTPVDRYVNTLYNNALRLGKNVTGLIIDKTNEHGDTMGATKRCWPMTELIKASIAQAKHTRCPNEKEKYEQQAANAISCMLTHFINPKVKGSYYDQLDTDNNVINSHAPASTLYHLAVACHEVHNYCLSLNNSSILKVSNE
ncbi:AGE family epimerase/isomerase [Thalassotalea sp. PLHSN55]|uniref:AGE family epimerase/isomerase n=1 Tax=Thalassotalea sp. PLHSN55 TaxID=3435888 RepID=UPI003F8650FF